MYSYFYVLDELHNIRGGNAQSTWGALKCSNMADIPLLISFKKSLTSRDIIQ